MNVYRMERRGSGSGTSFLFLDNAGAKERAELEAKHKVNTQLEEEQDPVPCPACAWVQSGMIPHARGRYHVWMFYVGFVGAVGAFFWLLVDLFMIDIEPIVPGRTALNRDEIATASFSSADALYVEPNHRDWAILGRNLADSGRNRVLNGPELVHFVHEH